MHWPDPGSVWHSARFSGSVTDPVFAVAVIAPAAPTLTVATANAAAPPGGRCRIPSFNVVAPSATISGTGLAEDDNSSVFNPVWLGAGKTLLQAKLNGNSFGMNTAVGVSAITKVCAPLLPGMSTGVFAVPVSALVRGSVV